MILPPTLTFISRANETNTPHEPFLTVQCSNTSIRGFTTMKLQCHRSALRSFNNFLHHWSTIYFQIEPPYQYHCTAVFGLRQREGEKYAILLALLL